MKEPLKSYIDATNTHNFDNVEKLIDKNAEYIFSGTTLFGVDEIRAYFEKTWSKIKDEKYWATDVKWIHESNDTMICLYRYNFSGYMNGTFITGGGRATNVFIKSKVAGEWKLIHEHLSK